MGFVCLLLCKEEGSSPVSATTERRDMGLYEVPLSMSLFDFWDISQLPYVLYYVAVKSSFKHARAGSKRAYVFMFLMFSLSRPCELLFLLGCIASCTWVVVSVMLYPCILCVALLMNSFVLCVACLTVFVSKFISSFKTLRAGSQVFALLMLFLCVILHTMWSGKSLLLLCILPFGILCFVCHQNDVCENYIGSVYVGGSGGLSDSGLCFQYIVSSRLSCSPVRTACVMLVVCRMQCCMSESTVLWCMDVLSRGGI